MAPQLSEDEIDDLVYFARAGENDDLAETLKNLSEREKVTPGEILVAARDDAQSTPLHMATGNGHLKTVQLLLDSFQTGQVKEKAEFMDMPNANGNSGLHWAAFNGHLEIVKLLLENGASPDLANKIAAQNQNADKPEAGSSSSYLAPSPSYLAEFNGNPQVADFLRNYLEDKEKETELSNTVKTMELDAEEAEGSGDSDDKRGKAEGESKAS